MMHTIKVNVHECEDCGFYWEDDEAGYLCTLAAAINPYDMRGLDEDQKEAPDWCPARDGVQIEEEK